MVTVEVELGERSYPILVGSGLLADLGSLLADRFDARRTLVVSDETVSALYSQTVLDSLSKAGWDATLITVPPGEPSKSLAQAARVYDALANAALERNCPIIALGGGVVGDLTGFVAATWLRGVPFVQVPTTVEADIDASVGGKTAVDHPKGKNLIGAFHQPRAVVIDVTCLNTLQDRDVIAGLAESVKHGVIRDAAFFNWQQDRVGAILARDADTLTELIAWNCRIKAAVVSEDERESGLRAILNYGHTIGHAVEAECGYGLRHGECVAIGMVAANHIAHARSLLTAEQVARIHRLLEAFGLPTQLVSKGDPTALLARMRHDKKSVAGRVNFVLPSGIGATVITNDVTPTEAAAAIAAIQP